MSFKGNQPNFPPISINGLQIERVEKLSILSLSIRRDLKWKDHVDEIFNKAPKRITRVGLPEYLSEVIETIQRRAFRIIYPQLSYQDALDTLGLQTLYARRRDLCNELFDPILSDEEHKLRKFLPPKVTSNTYDFRNDNVVSVGLEIH